MEPSEFEFEDSLTRKSIRCQETSLTPKKFETQTEHLKIQPRLILDLESPPETNGTLGISIRASEPHMLTKVNSLSKFHNFSNLGPQFFVSTPNSTP
uniref:Putative ovule protein n=1 Tax=Solanum chacoense TaxID=4108 RepID=A0A0V0ITX7_SOLCH